VPEPEPPGPPVEPGDHPTIGKGDTGPDVAQVQTVLGIIPADGDFGSITEGGVKGFQRATGLGADGIVGPDTWDELDDLESRKTNGVEPLSPKLIADICDAVERSEIANYNWNNRGKMPLGYTQGVALCFALAQKWLADVDPAAVRMARKNTGNEDKDVLAWYDEKFDALGMDNSRTVSTRCGTCSRSCSGLVLASHLADTARAVTCRLPMCRATRRKPACIRRHGTSARATRRSRRCWRNSGKTPTAS
jgi:hypothetical protein